ncbi:MAG: DUF2156 domain-containing protein, partial [Deltaproteobacteria bacterium]|nr:DUF2156 domain-containing protein [Deltaproteobacteria bacterium]
VGAGDKKKALDDVFHDLRALNDDARICRAGKTFVDQHVNPAHYLSQLDRDNSDYVYLASDLIRLAGRKFHRKKNHVNRFKKNAAYEYRPLDIELVECFLDMQEHWCQMRECTEKPDLLSEDYAIYQALTHFEDLDFRGGAIVLDSGVEAFSLGESLNPETAVIHIEKANPDITGLCAAINQIYCLNTWSDITYINREQDLGIEGLRKAKESYYPNHMVDKYIVTAR